MTNKQPRKGIVNDGLDVAIKVVDASTDLAIHAVNEVIDFSQDIGNTGIDKGQVAINKINELKKELLDLLQGLKDDIA